MSVLPGKSDSPCSPSHFPTTMRTVPSETRVSRVSDTAFVNAELAESVVAYTGLTDTELR